jgi:tRNA threonylcarbamoyl adenosine modification protein YeaZ
MSSTGSPAHLKYLAFDTSSDQLVVGCAEIHPTGTSFTLRSHQQAMNQSRQSERLLPSIDLCLKGAQWKVQDLDGLIIGMGPGSFTGLRIGIATARTLASSLSLKVIALSSLVAQGWNAFNGIEGEMCGVLTPATRAECYAALWSKNDLEKSAFWSHSLPPIGLHETVGTAEHIHEWAHNQGVKPMTWLSVGELKQWSAARLNLMPGAGIKIESLFEIGLIAIRNNSTLEPSQLKPHYVKSPSARPEIRLFNK